MCTRGVFFIGKTSVFTFLEHLNRMLGSSLIANFLLTKICPYGLSRASEVHQRNPWILPFSRMGRGQHMPCTVQLDAQSFERSLARCNFSTTTRAPHTPTPHHTQPPNHPTNNQQRAAQGTTQQKNTKTHTYTHMYMYKHMYIYMYLYLYVYVYVYVNMYMSVSPFLLISHEKTRSGTRAFHDVYCSKHLTFHNGSTFPS